MTKAKTLSVLVVAIAGVAAASWSAFAASPALTGPTPASYPIINVESKEVVGQYTIPSDLLIEKMIAELKKNGVEVRKKVLVEKVLVEERDGRKVACGIVALRRAAR